MTHVRHASVLGNRIEFYDRGQGAALVLVHGMFGDHLDWEPVLEPLAEHYRVIALDLPGFGDSDKPDIQYTAEFFVATLVELFSQLRLTEITLVGNSFGGSISIAYTLAHPDRVSRLALVSSAGMVHFTDEQQTLFLSRFTEQTIAALTPAIKEAMLSRIFARQSPWRDRYIAKQLSKLSRPDFQAYARSLSRSAQTGLARYMRDQLPQIQCPTLLVWGDEDAVFPLELAHKALKKLPLGILKVMPGCGHVPQLDDPTGFVKAIRDFVPLQAASQANL